MFLNLFTFSASRIPFIYLRCLSGLGQQQVMAQLALELAYIYRGPLHSSQLPKDSKKFPKSEMVRAKRTLTNVTDRVTISS
jgi:hypothetical protein